MTRPQIALLLGLLGCDEPAPARFTAPVLPPVGAPTCSAEEAALVFQRRIEPLLSDDRPQSCQGCHLKGLDLSAFVRDTPCQSMACLIDTDMVDLAQPSESHILGLIDRARGGPSPAAAEAEYQGFLAWIEHSARCHVQACGIIDDSCEARPPEDGPRPPNDRDAGLERRDLGVATGPLQERDAWVERGRVCDRPSLELRFQARVMRWRGRCASCHADDGATPGIHDAPLWLAAGTDPAAARRTLRRLEAAGDLEGGAQAPLALKPLSVGLGGSQHGGGDKFSRLDDPSYLDFLDFLGAWAECEGAPDAGLQDAGVAGDLGLPREAAPEVVSWCDCLLATCHDPYHALYGADEYSARIACLRQGTRQAETLGCRTEACRAAPTPNDLDACGVALGEVECR